MNTDLKALNADAGTPISYIVLMQAPDSHALVIPIPDDEIDPFRPGDSAINWAKREHFAGTPNYMGIWLRVGGS